MHIRMDDGDFFEGDEANVEDCFFTFTHADRDGRILELLNFAVFHRVKLTVDDVVHYDPRKPKTTVFTDLQTLQDSCDKLDLRRLTNAEQVRLQTSLRSIVAQLTALDATVTADLMRTITP